MGIDDCYLLGQLVKTHGLRGELIAHFDVDYPEEYQELESVFVEQNGKLVPFFIESISVRNDKVFLAFDDIDGIDVAAKLVGLSIYLPLENLPELKSGDYYFHQLVGMSLYDNDVLVGEVNDVYELPNNNLLGVMHQGVEVLIPLEDAIVKKVDLDTKRIDTDLPEGLIDVYLENN
jgi:16S rRNA processing protein RimM